jgi:prolyl 4-hydroxylase
MSIQGAVQSALLRRDVNEACRLLTKAAETGDGLAAFELGRWFLTGEIVPRDLVASRGWFCSAAALGHARSQLISAALLGNGVGGARDWPGALAQLRRASRKTQQAGEELRLIEQMLIDEEGNPKSIPITEQVSESPAVYWVRDLFSISECAALIAAAQPFLRKSVVVDPNTGQMRADAIRTSDAAMFPWIDETPFVHALNRRLAAASETDVKQGEPLQVLRYRPGQEYRPHFDAIDNAENQRVLTFLVYLNDDYEGGETEFIATGLKVKGRKGDGLLFRNADMTGARDHNSQHAGLPVTAGEKYLASRWIRERQFTPS